MTCREFMDAAEALTPVQLVHVEAEGQPVSAHARDCSACGTWLESQRLLGNALQSLRSRTEHREAGPKVEAAVLQAFRSQGFAPVAVIAPERSAPALWRLSRVFEFGAYAAVAAALIVGVFLGARILRDKQSAETQAQVQTASTSLPVNTGTSAAAASVQALTVSTEAAAKPSSMAISRGAQVASKQVRSTSVAAARSSDNAGFVALMLCDPLICSGDEQVIRMELPASAAASADGSAAQTVIADVVVGDDGLIRAMRIVN
jgi:hypothetical protein